MYAKGTKNDAYMKEARYGKQICSGAEKISAHAHGRDLHGDAADGDPGAASQRDCRVCSQSWSKWIISKTLNKLNHQVTLQIPGNVL